MADSAVPEQTLQQVAELIATSLGTEVCSIYLLDRSAGDLVLKATVGLKAQAVGSIRLSPGEGLTGLTMEQKKPLLVIDPASHPRFKLFAHSGEDVYQTFLGVPLVYHQENLGVMVLQTVRADGLTEDDLELCSAIATQISAIAAYSGLLQSVREGQPPPDRGGRHDGARSRNLLRGIPACSGFASGQAHVLGAGVGFDAVDRVRTADPGQDQQRFDRAVQTTVAQVSSLISQIDDLSPQDQDVLKTHKLLLQDQTFLDKVGARIGEGATAEFGLKQVVEEYLKIFRKVEDPYLRERGKDIEDVGKSILRNLLGIPSQGSKVFEQPTIVVATDLSPAELVALRQTNFKGLILSRGGKTSHAVILAQSFEIPTVIRAREAVERIPEGQPLIVDGSSGLIFRSPPEEIQSEYERLAREHQRMDREMETLVDVPAETADGTSLALGGNIGMVSDLELVKKYGADHIGLYRTEFPFVIRGAVPSEQDQTELYTRILEGAQGRTVCFRTLDVGGDKLLTSLDYPDEDNPNLGWRAIRVSLELEDIFRAQIRAVLRASTQGPIKLMFPMITTRDELQRAVSMVEDEKSALSRAGEAFAGSIPLGMMIEVPGTVGLLDHLLDLVDFASIGTNDLIQYALAVDRNNPKVASLYTPFHPAVLKLVHQAVLSCQSAGVPVSVCGEAAAHPKCALLFLGMGVRSLSMNPAAVPRAKSLLRSVTVPEAEAMVHEALKMDSSEAIESWLEEKLRF